MKPSTGALLRLLGPLIEVICLVLLLRYPGDRVLVAGYPLRYLLYGGILAGLFMVIAGITLVKRPQRARRPPDDY
jgi:hypothetical protein